MKFSTTVRRTSRGFDVDSLTRSMLLRIANGVKAEAIKPAIELTSGTISTAQLAAMDHPFARRNRTPQGRLRPSRSARITAARKSVRRIAKLPINRQTGALQRAIKVNVRSTAGTRWRVHLTINHPHAVVLSPQGTRYMIPRGFAEELNKRMNSQRMMSRLRGVIRRTRLR